MTNKLEMTSDAVMILRRRIRTGRFGWFHLNIVVPFYRWQSKWERFRYDMGGGDEG